MGKPMRQEAELSVREGYTTGGSGKEHGTAQGWRSGSLQPD